LEEIVGEERKRRRAMGDGGDYKQTLRGSREFLMQVKGKKGGKIFREGKKSQGVSRKG